MRRHSRAITRCRACAADLLQRLGRLEEARAAFTAAAALTANTRERALLERRAAACSARVVCSPD